MTTDELNAIVKAVMTELEKAGVDFDFKAETPQADDLVYVMRGTADKYQGITVKWQNLLDIIVQKATEARDDAISAKDIALQTLATIQGIESNVSSMKTSVETTKSQVETMKGEVSTMKASVEASEANVTQMKSDVSTMKTSVEGTKTEVEGLKSDVTNLKAQTQTIVDNAKEEVTGLLDTKINKTDALTYEEIMASTPPVDLDLAVAKASALKNVYDELKRKTSRASSTNPLNLNTCLDLYTTYMWDFGGSQYVTYNGINVGSSAGSVINFPNLDNGVTQVFVNYVGEEIKFRVLYAFDGTWSEWKNIAFS